jgi:hypothetical protein
VSWQDMCMSVNGGRADRKGEYLHNWVAIADGSSPV